VHFFYCCETEYVRRNRFCITYLVVQNRPQGLQRPNYYTMPYYYCCHLNNLFRCLCVWLPSLNGCYGKREEVNRCRAVSDVVRHCRHPGSGEREHTNSDCDIRQSESVSEWVSDRVSDRVSEWVTVSEWVSECVTVSEWVNEWQSEWVSKWVSKWVTEWVNEWQWVSEWVTEWVSE
jgi:hypothetical protein